MLSPHLDNTSSAAINAQLSCTPSRHEGLEPEHQSNHHQLVWRSTSPACSRRLQPILSQSGYDWSCHICQSCGYPRIPYRRAVWVVQTNFMLVCWVMNARISWSLVFLHSGTSCHSNSNHNHGNYQACQCEHRWRMPRHNQRTPIKYKGSYFWGKECSFTIKYRICMM